MLILEYKLRTTHVQQTAIDEAIRTVQFIRNKAVRLWMDGRGVGQFEMQALCSQLAQEYPFAARREFHGPVSTGLPGLGLYQPLLQELPRAQAGQEGLSPVPERP